MLDMTTEEAATATRKTLRECVQLAAEEDLPPDVGRTLREMTNLKDRELLTVLAVLVNVAKALTDEDEDGGPDLDVPPPDGAFWN